MSLVQSPSRPDFHVELQIAIDETISNLLGERILESLYEHLTKEHDLPPDKLPYQLNTFIEVLDKVFGAAGSRTIGWAIARDFYSKIGLRFVHNESFRLQDYLEQAKKTISIHD